MTDNNSQLTGIRSDWCYQSVPVCQQMGSNISTGSVYGTGPLLSRNQLIPAILLPPPTPAPPRAEVIAVVEVETLLSACYYPGPGPHAHIRLKPLY